jgi:hypothetical protein
MGLGAFDIVSSFLTGVQERSEEIDKDNRDLAERFKTLSEGKGDTNLKTKFAKEVDNYNKDKNLLKAVKSAYASNDWATAQQLLGGFDSLDAYWKARKLNPEIYYKLPKLGEEPLFTKADYGVTNGTTIGRIVESFVNPEAEEKRKESEIPTAATYTKYGRKTDEEGNIEYARSEEEVAQTKLDLIELQKAYEKPTTQNYIKDNEDGSFTKYTLTLHPEGLTGDTAKSLGGDSNIYKGYQVTNKEPYQPSDRSTKRGTIQEHIEQRWVLNGNIANDEGVEYTKETEGAEYLDVTFKSKYTGNKDHSITYANGTIDVGWNSIGHKVEKVTDTALTKTGKWVMADFDLRPEMWKEVITNIGYEGDAMTPQIANTIARTIDGLKLNLYDGTLIDTLNSLKTTTKVSDIPEKLDWTTISLGDTQQYTYDYLRGDSSRTVPYEGPTGAVSQLKIFDNLVKESADDYESFINSYAREFSNTYHVGIVPAVNLMERIAGLALKERDKGFLGFKRLSSDELLFDSGTVLYTENNKDFTVENVVMEIEQFRADYLETVKDKNYSWGQIATYVIRKVKEKQAGNN